MIAYVDDTGTHDGALDCTLIALLAPKEAWARFNNEWIEECNKPPSTPDFHMKDCIRITRSCWGDQIEPDTPLALLQERRDIRLAALRSITRRNVSAAFRVSVRREAYERLVREQIPKKMDDPYFICFWHLQLMVARQIERVGDSTSVQFIFDDQGKTGRLAAEQHESVVQSLPDPAAKILGIPPQFAHDKECMPIKAADLVAWYFQRHWTEVTNGKAPTNQQAINELSAIPGVSTDITDEGLVTIRASINGDGSN